MSETRTDPDGSPYVVASSGDQTVVVQCKGCRARNTISAEWDDFTCYRCRKRWDIARYQADQATVIRLVINGRGSIIVVYDLWHQDPA